MMLNPLKQAAARFAASLPEKSKKSGKPVANGEKPKVELPLYTVRLPDGRWTTIAGATRSEIRAQAKKDFKLDRLPVGTEILTMAE